MISQGYTSPHPPALVEALQESGHSYAPFGGFAAAFGAFVRYADSPGEGRVFLFQEPDRFKTRRSASA